jgi:hypothetical protein
LSGPPSQTAGLYALTRRNPLRTGQDAVSSPPAGAGSSPLGPLRAAQPCPVTSFFSCTSYRADAALLRGWAAIVLNDSAAGGCSRPHAWRRGRRCCGAPARYGLLPQRSRTRSRPARPTEGPRPHSRSVLAPGVWPGTHAAVRAPAQPHGRRSSGSALSGRPIPAPPLHAQTLARRAGRGPVGPALGARGGRAPVLTPLGPPAQSQPARTASGTPPRAWPGGALPEGRQRWCLQGPWHSLLGPRGGLLLHRRGRICTRGFLYRSRASRPSTCTGSIGHDQRLRRGGAGRRQRGETVDDTRDHTGRLERALGVKDRRASCLSLAQRATRAAAAGRCGLGGLGISYYFPPTNKGAYVDPRPPPRP